MKKHDFDFDSAVTMSEFFKNNGLKKKEDKRIIFKTCHPDNEGEEDEHGNTIKPFEAVGFYNGGTTDDGRDSYTFFVLSSKLEKEGHTLNKSFLAKHKKDLMLLENEDLKFGLLYLPGEAILFDDLDDDEE